MDQTPERRTACTARVRSVQVDGAGARRSGPHRLHHAGTADDQQRGEAEVHRLTRYLARRDEAGRLAGLVTLVAVLALLTVANASGAPQTQATFRFGNATTSWWAPLEGSVTARARPSAGAPVVARVAARTPEGTTTIVRLLERVASGGRLWLRVSLPVLPNGTTGWVERDDVGGYQRTSTRLVIDRAALTATLFSGRRRVQTARIGIGQARWPTPPGIFFVRNELTKFASPAYGPIAFGLSARSAVLTDWPAGGFVGIHGTNRPGILPGRVSHGCIRLRNDDILRLARVLAPGDLVVVR